VVAGNFDAVKPVVLPHRKEAILTCQRVINARTLHDTRSLLHTCAERPRRLENESPMNALYVERAHLPVYLERHAGELDAMRRTATAARTSRNVATDVRIYPEEPCAVRSNRRSSHPTRPHAYDDGGRLKSAR